MDVLLAKLPGDPVANAAAVGAALLALLDFILGTGRAVANGTFVWESFSTWVRAQLLGHVFPIIVCLTFGQVIGKITIPAPSGDISFNVLIAAGLAAAGTYAAVTLKSIIDSLNPNAPDPVPPPAT